MLALTLLATLANAAESGPALQLDAAFTMFDQGLSLLAKPAWKQTLWDKEGSLLLDGTHVTPAAWLQLTPDFARAGGELSFSPAAVFEIRGHALATQYFGNVNTIVGFEDKKDTYGPDDREGQEKNSGSTLRAGVAPILRAKVGSVVVVLAGERQWVKLTSEATNEPYWFEPESQLLLSHDETITSGTGLLAWSGTVSDWELITGLLGTWRSAEESGDSLLRVGPMVKAQATDSKTSYLLLVQPHLKDRVFGPSQPFTAVQVRYAL